ncbi:hypothetical protein [Aeromicrobium panaciterrae]|uniref:hypothetical protein n=1 Tax=Aeromicrobium panaciterrae TaxID=363861 RepID=UPI0031DEC13C
MTTSTVTPEIVSFARGVRAALADLPADEVDELTDGLEADLAEAYAEDLQRELPDPVAYAAELRLAAGLPVRTKVRHGALGAIGDSLRDTRRDIGIAIHRNPMLSGIADFLGTLRPVWWVLRAWLATWLVAAFFGSEQGYWFGGTGWFFVLAAFIVVSVQLGLGRWQGRGIATFVLIGNVVAILALPIVKAAADNGGSDRYTIGFQDGVSAADPEQVSGLTIQGEPVTNIFAYGADGNPLRNVQLFDQSGHPINLFGDSTEDGVPCAGESQDCSELVQPATLETGQTTFNLFPLGTVPSQWDDSEGASVPIPGAKATYGPAPFVKVPAVMPGPKVQPTP